MKKNPIRIFYDENGIMLIGELVEQMENAFLFKNLFVIHETENGSLEIAHGDVFYGFAEGNLVTISENRVLYYARASLEIAEVYRDLARKWEKHLMEQSEKKRLKETLTVVSGKGDKND